MIAYMIKLKEIPFASDWLAKGDFIFLDYKYNYKYIITYSKLCGSSTTLTHEKEWFHIIFFSFFPRRNGKLGNS